MLRKMVAILLIASTLATLARFAIPYIWYYANYEYITTELCVNRHNPEVECNGYCILSTKIKTSHHDGEAGTDHQVPPNRNVEQLLSINLFFEDGFSYPKRVVQKNALLHGIYNVAISTSWYGDITTPPPQLSI
jgi:hypothetical protein